MTFRYALTIAVIVGALLLSLWVRPIIEPNPFLIFFGAVAFCAWYGGIWPGLLATVLSVQAVNYFFITPIQSFQFSLFDGVRMAIFALISIFISSLSELRMRAEQTAHQQGEQLRVTLASIGDAVVVTDAEGRVTFLNEVAEELTGWPLKHAAGVPSEQVFRIVNADTRLPVESPVAQVISTGRIVGLANHTILIARNGVERPIDDSGAPIRDAFGRLTGVVLVFRDISAREEAETARKALLVSEQAARAAAEHGREQAAFLAEASRLLAGSLDYHTTLRQITDLLVPHVADWCVVDMLDDDGRIQLVAMAHVDPAKVEWGHRLRRAYPIDPDAPAGAPYVIRTGEPQLFLDIPDSLLESVARDPQELEMLRMVGYRSIMVVPLRARGRVFGSVAFVLAESERRYREEDRIFAQELADRAAVAIDNARLYQASHEEIARRQRIEAAFKTSEAQLRLIADTLPVLISYLGSDLRYRFNNRTYEEWFGHSRTLVTGRHISDVIGETAYAHLRWYLEEALAGRQVSFETKAPYRSGERHIHATYVPDHAEDGSVRGIVVLVEDISTRVKAQEGQHLLVAAGALLASSLDYEAILSHVVRLLPPTLGDYAILYLVDGDQQIRRSACAHVDPEQEFLLRELDRRYPFERSGDSPVAQVLRSGVPFQTAELSDAILQRMARDSDHLELLHAIGPRSLLAVPLQARGRTLGVLLCATTSHDRHYSSEDRRLIEELAYRAALAIDNAMLYRATEAARDTAEQSAHRIALLQHVTELLGATTTPTQVAEVIVQEGLSAAEADAGAVFILVEANTQWEAVSFRGYPPELSPTHVRTPTSFPSPLQAVLETHELVLVETPEEMLRRWPNLAASQAGSGDAAVAAVPLLLDQELLGVLYVAFRAPRSFSTDDCEFLEALGRQGAQALDRARLYEAERAARSAAEEAIRLRDLFLSVASHELKTPLTSLLLQAQLLQRRVSRADLLPEREQQTLQVVADQAQRLDRMIAALLDISRLELGQLSLSLAPLDMAALARRVVAEVAPTTEQHAITCVVPAAPLWVDGDELRLEQVLQNLIQNAIKYSPDGGPVEVEVGHHDQQICMSVSDMGIGLPEEALPRLFERFYRAPNADPRHISGMGIGLYVVREIVRLHGGTVSASARAGGGSSFTVCLPQRAETSD